MADNQNNVEETILWDTASWEEKKKKLYYVNIVFLYNQ